MAATTKLFFFVQGVLILTTTTSIVKVVATEVETNHHGPMAPMLGKGIHHDMAKQLQDTLMKTDNRNLQRLYCISDVNDIMEDLLRCAYGVRFQCSCSSSGNIEITCTSTGNDEFCEDHEGIEYCANDISAFISLNSFDASPIEERSCLTFTKGASGKRCATIDYCSPNSFGTCSGDPTCSVTVDSAACSSCEICSIGGEIFSVYDCTNIESHEDFSAYTCSQVAAEITYISCDDSSSASAHASLGALVTSLILVVGSNLISW